MRIYSITATWALETSIDTADAMKARGYGKGKRTNYHNFKFEARDALLVTWIVILSAGVIFAMANGWAHNFFYPTFDDKESIVQLLIYSLLCMTPIAINLWEGLRWHILKSKS